MYLQEIYLKNTGPISQCHVKLPFADDGTPRPVVIVGPNGSGKTIFLSYIVDALIEFAKKAFHDIVPPGSPGSQGYFRIISPSTIRSGEQFSLSLLHFKANDDNLYYYENLGKLDSANFSDVPPVFPRLWHWEKEVNPRAVSGVYPKEVSGNERTIETEMRSGAYAFFPGSRHEDPDWLNPESLHPRMDIFANKQIMNVLNKPLWVETSAEENISWILDVLLETFSVRLATFNLSPIKSKVIFGIDIKSVERILKTILQDPAAEFMVNPRDFGSSRISIKRGDDRPSIPSLQSLSEGQSQLFHLFATIIRYGEQSDLNNSVDLSQITGLVGIDDIAAHLHPTHQHDILPKLIELFPKVQFILSAHSPLFLLGMEKAFGTDGVTILELPDGNRIDSERYSEFGKAFEYYQNTESFENKLKEHLADLIKPIVLTEGKTDAQYIKKALVLLGEEELLNSLEIQPVGSEGEKGAKYGGKDGLNRVHTFYTKNPSLKTEPILLLYDSDAQKKDEDFKDLYVRSIPQNDQNTKVKTGIENLFPENRFSGCFYGEVTEERDDGGRITRVELNKPRFCEWICENGSVDDFKKFESVVRILKEFLEATQPTPGQQPPSEQ